MIRGRRPRGPQRRDRHLERVLLVAELLSPLRNGATATELAADVCDILGEPYVSRTIRRDLDALEQMGVVERLDVMGGNCSHGGDQYRWRWVAGSRLAAACEQMAECASMRREGMPLQAAG